MSIITDHFLNSIIPVNKFNKWHNYIFYALQLTYFLSLGWKLLITYQILKHKPSSMRRSTDDVVRAFHVALYISLWILLFDILSEKFNFSLNPVSIYLCSPAWLSPHKFIFQIYLPLLFHYTHTTGVAPTYPLKLYRTIPKSHLSFLQLYKSRWFRENDNPYARFLQWSPFSPNVILAATNP